MNVLRVIPSMDPKIGGPCQGIRNSIPELNKLGFNNEVVCLDSEDATYLGNDIFPIHGIGPSKGPWGYSSRLIPWLIANFNRFDIVIIHGLWQFHSHAVFAAIAKYKTDNEARVPKILVMPHGMLDPWFQRSNTRKLKAIRNLLYWQFIEKKVINNADALMFTCERELELAREPFKPYKPKKELNVGYGIVAPPFKSEDINVAFDKLGLGQYESYILFLSRIDVKKGLHLLVAAYLRLEKEGIQLPHLVVAGPGLDSEYGRRIESLASASSKVKFMGMLSGYSKWAAFYGCESYILPSHQENFGISVVEALACGKPVLISDQINIYKEIEAGGAAFVQPDTEEGVYQLLLSWTELSAAKRELMSRNARHVYEDHFTTAKAASKMADSIWSLSSQ